MKRRSHRFVQLAPRPFARVQPGVQPLALAPEPRELSLGERPRRALRLLHELQEFLGSTRSIPRARRPALHKVHRLPVPDGPSGGGGSGRDAPPEHHRRLLQHPVPHHRLDPGVHPAVQLDPRGRQHDAPEVVSGTRRGLEAPHRPAAGLDDLHRALQPVPIVLREPVRGLRVARVRQCPHGAGPPVADVVAVGSRLFQSTHLPLRGCSHRLLGPRRRLGFRRRRRRFTVDEPSEVHPRPAHHDRGLTPRHDAVDGFQSVLVKLPRAELFRGIRHVQQVVGYPVALVDGQLGRADVQTLENLHAIRADDLPVQRRRHPEAEARLPHRRRTGDDQNLGEPRRRGRIVGGAHRQRPPRAVAREPTRCTRAREESRVVGAQPHRQSRHRGAGAPSVPPQGRGADVGQSALRPRSRIGGTTRGVTKAGATLSPMLTPNSARYRIPHPRRHVRPRLHPCSHHLHRGTIS